MSRRLAIPILLLPYIGLMVYFVFRMQLDRASLLVLLPIGIAVGMQILKSFETFVLFTVFTVPMSMGLKDIGGGLGMSVPAEPLLLVSGIAGIIYLIREGLPFKGLFKHPIVILVLVQHAWVLTTSLSSSYNSTSFKFFAARSLFLIVYFFLFLHLFQKHKGGIRFLWVYLLGLFPILIYSIVKLAQVGLARKYSPDMGEPFFDDHTILGATVAMLLPSAWLFFRRRKSMLQGMYLKRMATVIFAISLLALFLSFSRAAWMSIVAASAFYFLLRIKTPFYAIVLGFLMLVAAGFYWQDDLVERMRKNENVSGEDIVMMAKSVTNVSTDESNQERVNRWSCAVRMWEDRPWMGFGPGTYEQVYPPYQIKSEKTRISSNEGDRGDAHSEYLTALSEQGLPGLLIFLALIFASIWTGMRITYRAKDERTRRLGQAILLGLLTFFIHGAVNSFLDLDEAATLFWGMTGLLVALDLGSREDDSTKNSILDERRSVIEGC